MPGPPTPVESVQYLCERCWFAFPSPTAHCPGPTCGTTKPPAGWARLPYTYASRFEFLRRLGGGGMGVVFLARDKNAKINQDDDGTRAVKVVPTVARPEVVDDLIWLFQREAAVAGWLGSSTCFVGVHGWTGGREPWLSMDYVNAPTLTKHLFLTDDQGDLATDPQGALIPVTLSAEEVALLGIQILEGVERLRHVHVVHRDLKPDNIFAWRKSGASGWGVKISDFGVAFRKGMPDTDPSNQRPGSRRPPTIGGRHGRVGTAGYMSPEQVRGDFEVSEQSDLHSVGSILWQALTGDVPFPPVDGEDDVQKRQLALLEVMPPRPPAMPEPIYEVLCRALQFRVADRWPEARQMSAALSAYVAGLRRAEQAAFARAEARMEGLAARLGDVRQRLDGLGRVEDAAGELAASVERLRAGRGDLGAHKLDSKVALLEASVQGIETDLQRRFPMPVAPPEQPPVVARRTIVLSVVAGLAALVLACAAVLLWPRGTQPVVAGPVTPPPAPARSESFVVTTDGGVKINVALNGKPVCTHAHPCALMMTGSGPFKVELTDPHLRPRSFDYNDLEDAHQRASTDFKDVVMKSADEE